MSLNLARFLLERTWGCLEGHGTIEMLRVAFFCDSLQKNKVTEEGHANFVIVYTFNLNVDWLL
jgi:hypothetical protein